MEPSIKNILETVKVNSQYEPPSAERPSGPAE
jgi:hypothetical protein